MTRWIARIFLVFLATGCRGERTPPIRAGAGLQLVNGANGTQTLAVDEQVAIVAGCPVGHVVERGPAGFRCREPGALIGGILRSGVGDLEVRIGKVVERVADRRPVDELDTTLAEAEEALASRRRQDAGRPFRLASASCVSKPAAYADIERVGADRVRHRGAALGDISLYCPLVATSVGLSFSRFELTVDDPDGRGPDAKVSATLIELSLSGGIRPIAAVDSNATGSVGTSVLSAALARLDFDANYYFVEIHLERSTTAVAPAVATLVFWP